MKKIRAGNDVHIVWTITKNDEISESLDALDLEGAEVLLIDSFNHPAAFKYSITTIDENTTQVTGTFFGKDQKTQGKYRLLLVKNKGEEGMITLDFVDAFILTCVSKFGVISGNDESSITTATIQLESQFSSYNGSPDMTGYYTKQECDDKFIHKNLSYQEYEDIYGNKGFNGVIDFNGDEINLPGPDSIWMANGQSLAEYVSEHGGGGGGGDLSNYYTKSETQNYVTSRIEDSTQNQSHDNTWTSYAITDYVAKSLPQMSNYYTKNETQNYVTSRIEDSTQNQSHNNTWTSYAIADYIRNSMPQMSNYYTKNETQNYVTSRIEDNTQNQSHNNTWTSYAIADYIRNSMPQYFGNVLDNFANCTPILTKEYTITSKNYRRLFTFTNSDEDLRSQTGWCEGRITITNDGGTINGKYSFLVRLNGQIQGWLQCQDLGTTNTTRGLYQMVLRTPNAANNGSDWMVDIVCNGANSTTNARNITLEIISKSDNCTIVADDNDVTYANTAQVTIQNTGNNMFYMSSAGALQINANTANSALQLSNKLTKYLNCVSNVVGAQALTIGDLIFTSATDNKLYNISNTTQPIDLDGGVMEITSAQAANANATCNYMATICGNSCNLAGMGTTYPSTWTTGRPLYLKCTYPDANGDIYSLNEIVLDKSAGGYTYYLLGRQTSTSQRIALNTENSQFYSLNASGKLTHINGMELA